MDVQITPVKLAGHVTLPASKSHCHRLLIASYLTGRRFFGLESLRRKERIMNQWRIDKIMDSLKEAGLT